MSGLIGKKIGMTSLFDDMGKNIPCTVLELGPCVVTQVRTTAVDGYEAVQLSFDDKAEKLVTRPQKDTSKKPMFHLKISSSNSRILNKN